MRAIAEEARRELQRLRASQLQSTDAGMRDESAREGAAVQAMLTSIRRARELEMSGVLDRAAEWGRSRARNELARLSLSAFGAAEAEEGQAEGLREEAVGLARTAALAAAEMVGAAERAELVARSLADSDAMRLVGSVGGQNGAALARVQHALRLSELARSLVQRAKTLAGSALSRATSAEASAARALSTARSNTRRIARLKARVEAAQQQAQAAYAVNQAAR